MKKPPRPNLFQNRAPPPLESLCGRAADRRSCPEPAKWTAEIDFRFDVSGTETTTLAFHKIHDYTGDWGNLWAAEQQKVAFTVLSEEALAAERFPKSDASTTRKPLRKSCGSSELYAPSQLDGLRRLISDSSSLGQRRLLWVGCRPILLVQRS